MKRILGVLALTALTISCGVTAQSGASKQISAEELEKLLEKKANIFYLDVREPSEIAHLGSVKGYVNIPAGQLEGRLKEIPRDKLIVTL
jgi:rhodanese-related sulfurtransferase